MNESNTAGGNALRPAEGLREAKRVPVEQLRHRCDFALLDFTTTVDLCPLQTIIGQERAVQALDFGLQVRHPGYNIFITGTVGTGRSTYAETKVREVAVTQSPPDDWCYVYNFHQPDQPVALNLPPGKGTLLRKDMAELVEELKTEIRRTFDSAEYEKRRNELVQRFEQRINALWQTLEESVRREGFAIQRTPTGILSVPLRRDGSPLSQEEFHNLPEEVRERVTTKGRELQGAVAENLRRARNLEKEAREHLKELERETGLYAAGHLISRLKEKYQEHPRVVTYLEQVLQDVIENLDDFRGDGGEGQPAPPFPIRVRKEDAFGRYRVNLLVNNGESKGAPVVIEPNPTYANLFGKVEYRGEMGTFTTDFSLIKAGALHLANGGYLILHARDLLLSPMAWHALKRALKSGQIRIENLAEQLGVVPTATLKPEPIPLQVKVVLIGNPMIYHLLYAHDEDFRKFFKVKADFDVEMDRTPEHMNDYGCFVSSICHREGLKHFDKTGVASIIEYSSRLAENQHKLSTRFNEVAEIIYEASAWADREGSQYVTAAHVQKALEEKVYRSNRIEEKIRELIAEGTIMVDTAGSVRGQVNGISVYNLGDYSFGKPSRITARTFLGERGVVNIERETDLSGRLHNKGVFILAAYLGGKYAQDKPLSLSASLCFEQLYEEVDGDSASSAELYALLSDLSGLPLDQGLAVTGSVNQKGEIQPIGGVNEKIEGFFRVCKVRGLDGKQGVVIPHQNVRNLMLAEEVVDAVRNGLFHIYAIHTVDEGIALLTGIEAGQPDGDGKFPPGTVNYLVNERLRRMAENLRQFARRPPDRGEGEGEKPEKKQKKEEPPPGEPTP